LGRPGCWWTVTVKSAVGIAPQSAAAARREEESLCLLALAAARWRVLAEEQPLATAKISVISKCALYGNFTWQNEIFACEARQTIPLRRSV